MRLAEANAFNLLMLCRRGAQQLFRVRYRLWLSLEKVARHVPGVLLMHHNVKHPLLVWGEDYMAVQKGNYLVSPRRDFSEIRLPLFA